MQYIDIAMVLAMLYSAPSSAPERLYASAIFVFAALAHMLVAGVISDIGGIAPYLIAATFDLIVVMMMAKIALIVPTIISLYRICLAEVVLNLIGWIMWDNGVRHYDTIYLSAFFMLNVYTVFILARKDRADDWRGFEVDSWGDILRIVVGKSGNFVQRSGKQA